MKIWLIRVAIATDNDVTVDQVRDGFRAQVDDERIGANDVLWAVGALPKIVAFPNFDALTELDQSTWYSRAREELEERITTP